MSIQKAIESLKKKLNYDDDFQIGHDGITIFVKVAYIYRMSEVPKQIDGYEIKIARRWE